MKLKDVKERIDKYFDNISAEELYEISISKYGFTEIISDLEDVKYQKISTTSMKKEESYFFSEKKISNKMMCNLLLAA